LERREPFLASPENFAKRGPLLDHRPKPSVARYAVKIVLVEHELARVKAFKL
jgi:hypothetical protein